MSRDCNRFRSLVEEKRDRDLTADEEAFLDVHRGKCSGCKGVEQIGAMALNMLSPFGVEDSHPVAHETRILRAARAQYLRASLRFWSPALAGVALGLLVMAAAIQMAGHRNLLEQSNNQGADARRLDSTERSFPDLNSVNLSR
ncbi:MAG: hypothetical protein ABL949_03255 [Fimbriimonadaceae bacterium]